MIAETHAAPRGFDVLGAREAWGGVWPLPLGMSNRTGRPALLTALALSLVLHVSAFGLARAIGEARVDAVTEARAEPSAPDVPSEPPPPEEEITPGLEKGAPAVVTWIGYEEYQEHLAELAPTDQAAFTSAPARGTPEAIAEAAEPDERLAEAPDEPTESPTELASGEHAAEPVAAFEATSSPEERPATPPREDASVPVADARETAAPLPAPEIDPPSRDAAEVVAAPTKSFSESPAAPVDQAEAAKHEEDARQEVAEEHSASTEHAVEARIEVRETEAPADPLRVPLPLALPVVSPPPAAAHGEPIPEDSTPSEKDSAATSTRDVPEVQWDNGKPLAREGLEIQPYSLRRHIEWDLKDILFSQLLNRGRWEGRVLRNPVVSLRFDRSGRAGDVRIIRPSGFKPLDEKYLATWMSRWTATGSRLGELAPDELTGALKIKIVFIAEPDASQSAGR